MMNAELRRALEKDSAHLQGLIQASNAELDEKLKACLSWLLAHSDQKVTPRLSPELLTAWRREGRTDA